MRAAFKLVGRTLLTAAVLVSSIGVLAQCTPVVTNLNDSGVGSLRDRLSCVAAGSTITFSVTGTVTLASPLAILQNVTIQGPGASQLALSGNNSVRVLDVLHGTTASISGITVEFGSSASAGGGISNSGTLALNSCVITNNRLSAGGFGAGILNFGNLAVDRCAFSNNTITGTATLSGSGGGIFNSPAETATITNSTFQGNVVTGAISSGGAIANQGNMTIAGSTFNGNQATNGGAIVGSTPTLVINSTIAGNTAPTGGGFFCSASTGCALLNTVVAGNTANLSPDVRGVFLGNHNLIGDGTGMTGLANGANGNIVGTGASPVNAALSALANNGGPTLTMLPTGNSPVLGAGDPNIDPTNVAPPVVLGTNDQRGGGFARVVNGLTDIGAVQLQGATLAVRAGSPQAAITGTPFATALQVKATENCASCISPVAGLPVTFAAPLSGASGTFSGSAAVTADSTGIATAPIFTANLLLGSYDVTAASANAKVSANSVSFLLTNVVSIPQVSRLSPASAPVGGTAFTLTVSGGNFVSGSTVQWNGSARLTTFVDQNTLTAQIPATDLVTATAASISVTTPASAVSNTVTFFVTATNEVVPQSGWWWDPKLNGTGFFVEYGGKSGNGMFIGGFLYDTAGNDTWLVSTGQYGQATSSYTNTWLKPTGGQTLTGPYKAPGLSTAGNVGLSFLDSTHAVMTRPDGTQVNLQRFSFSALPPAPPTPPVAGAPQSGWWWAGSSLSGTGYGIEIQGNAVFIVAYVYDSTGNPVWYLATGALTSPTSYSGTWQLYAGGPQLTSPEGTYSAHPVSGSDVGMSLTFSDATHGTLTMGSVSIPIVRFLEY